MAKNVYRTIQIKLKPEGLELLALEFMCEQANKLVNCAVYAVRQGYFMQGGTSLVKADYPSLDDWMKQIDLPHYRGIAAQASQQVLKGVVESFIGFDKLLQMYWHGKVEKPRLPGYRKKGNQFGDKKMGEVYNNTDNFWHQQITQRDLPHFFKPCLGGMAAVSFPVQAVQFNLETGKCRLPLGNAMKAESGIDAIWIQGAWGIQIEQISEVRILPRNGEFYAEYVYKATGKQALHSLDPTLALGIDPGRDNWLTCVSSLGKSFIVDGHKIKSINQLYNKRIASVKEGRPQGYWDAELARITEKRNRQMRDTVNKTARFIVNHCLENGLGTVVFGWNEGIKDGANMGKKNNQEFVQIPTARLKNRIKELCEEYGIEFVETEESYTSVASFLDGDALPTFGEKPEGYKPSGKRVRRGIYRTATGSLINADANAAANILRKVSIQLGLNLARVCRAALNLPKRYDLFSSLKKSYRKRCGARFQPA